MKGFLKNVGNALTEIGESIAEANAYDRKLNEISYLMGEIEEIRSCPSTYNKQVKIERKLKEMQEMIAEII